MDGLKDWLELVEVSIKKGENSINLGGPLFDKNSNETLYNTPLYLNSKASLKTQSVCKKIGIELAKLGHAGSEDAAGLVLALFSIYNINSDRNLQRLTDWISNLTIANVDAWFIMQDKNNLSTFKVGSFQFGPLDFPKFKYWCDKVGSNYAAMYGERHKGHMAVQTDLHEIKILPLAQTMGFSTELICKLLWDYYFWVLAQISTEIWLRRYEIEVASIVNFCKFPINLRVLHKVGFTECVSIFRRNNTKGYVSSHKNAFTITCDEDMWMILQRNLEAWKQSEFAKLRAEDDFPAWLSSGLQLSMRALNSLHHEENELAVITACAAIESLVTTTKMNLLESFVKYGTCINQFQSREPNHTAITIKTLYDARSKFVHDGMSVDQSHVEELVELARNVARAAHRATARSVQPRLFTQENWLNLLDAIIALNKIDAEVELVCDYAYQAGLSEQIVSQWDNSP